MMNGKIIFAFIAGAAVGAAVSWKYNEIKYSKLAEEEIESVREKFSIEMPEPDPAELETQEPTEEVVEEANEEEKDEYEYIVKEKGYTNYSNISKEEEGGGKLEDYKPYVISPDEYDTIDYETNELTYYADGILADDCDDILENVDEVVGIDSLQHFGEYADDPDIVYVRNDRLRTDYEITLDLRRYADVASGYPIGEED